MFKRITGRTHISGGTAADQTVRSASSIPCFLSFRSSRHRTNMRTKSKRREWGASTMRSSDAAGSFGARECLHTGVTRGRTFTRDDAGSHERSLSRNRKPFRRSSGAGGGGLARAAGGWQARPGGIIERRRPT